MTPSPKREKSNVSANINDSLWRGSQLSNPVFIIQPKIDDIGHVSRVRWEIQIDSPATKPCPFRKLAFGGADKCEAEAAGSEKPPQQYSVSIHVITCRTM
jgi:hypothetical protein